MHLPDSLKNQYYVMRHGESLANTADIIVSHPDNGISGYGLSEVGRQQVTAEISGCNLPQLTQIICSDFKRAHETAKIAHRILACQSPAILDARLRERNFGELELGSDELYSEVWSADQQKTNRSDIGVETVESVLDRALELILELESEYSDISFLLIAHGDVLQILQTAFSALPANHHRELPHLKTAELRRLGLFARNHL